MSIKSNLEIQSISIKYTIITLVSIALISLVLKLYTMDFSFPVNSDVLAYSLQAISHTNGDFSQSSHRGIGWSLFVSFFYKSWYKAIKRKMGFKNCNKMRWFSR